MKRYKLRSELSEDELVLLRKREREFYHVSRKSKPDFKEKSKARYTRDYEKNKPRFRNSRLKYEYGITLEDYEIMYEEQNGVCAICEGTDMNRMLSVDHCHDTGRVRGLLCGTCNRALGLFKDSPELLKRAKEYVS